MTRRVVLALLAGLLATAGARAADAKDNQDEAAAAMKKLEGGWKLIRKEYKGNLWPTAPGHWSGIFIEDGKITWTMDGREAGGQKGDLSIDPSTKPASIDVEITRGSNIGRKMLGIYEIKGNKLTICWGEPGEEKRPKKFITKTALGAGTTLETYQSLEADKGGDKTTADTKSGSTKSEDASAAALKKLEGNWKLVRKEYKGNLWPTIPGHTSGIFIEDGKITWTTDGREAGGDTGDVTVDPSTKPASIDVEYTRGSNIGRKMLGIYQVQGTKLTICWGEPGEEKRPKKFVTKATLGAGTVLETYQKQKD